jgi:DNA repair exonuclease SbcCD ATPase subunit
MNKQDKFIQQTRDEEGLESGTVHDMFLEIDRLYTRIQGLEAELENQPGMFWVPRYIQELEAELKRERESSIRLRKRMDQQIERSGEMFLKVKAELKKAREETEAARDTGADLHEQLERANFRANEAEAKLERVEMFAEGLSHSSECPHSYGHYNKRCDCRVARLEAALKEVT